MVGPNYHRPSAPVPAAFKELPGWKLATPADAAAKGAWWRIFNDPLLDRLEAQVAISNLTLRADEANYRSALAVVDEARASLLPVLSAAPGVTRSKSTGGTSAFTQYSLEGTASWTVDVWGSIRRTIQSDRALAQASEATLANALLTEQALLATDYLDLRVSDSLQRLLTTTVSNDQRALTITQNQYKAGVSARSDVLTAQTQLEAAQAAAINVGVARAQYEHAIAVLLGKPPSELTVAAVAEEPAVPSVPGLVPSALLERRPDIAAAERSMQSANALIGVAVAAYYPSVDLTALFGFNSGTIRNLLSNASRVWSLGANANATLFNGGEHSAAVRAARAAYDESVASYRLTVLTAFQQVEDNLSGLRILSQEDAVERATVKDAARVADITLNEYRAGTEAYTAVISAQNTLLSAQQNEIAIAQTRLTETVALIQALGGGWEASALAK